MLSASPLAQEKIWFDKAVYDLAEKKYYEKLAKPKGCKSVPPPMERKTEVNIETPMNKCFVGLQMDGTGKIKAPEKVWVDKRVYDLAEKEYYEKLEKLRLISLLKTNGVQEPFVSEKALENQVVEIAGKGTDTEVAVDNKNRLIRKENVLLEKQNSKKKIPEIDTRKSTDEITTAVTQTLNKPSELIRSPEKFTSDLKSDVDLVQTQPEIMDAEDKKTKSTPIKEVEKPPMIAQSYEDVLEKKVSNPGHNLKSVSIRQVDPVEVVLPKKHVKLDDLKEVKDNSKPQKGNFNDQNQNDTIKEKQKPADEKALQDSSVKGVSQNASSWNSLAGEVAKARQHIKNSLQCIDDIASITSSSVVIEVNNRINSLEKENSEMKQKVKELTDLLSKFEQRLANIEKNSRPVDVTLSKSTSTNVSAQPAKQQCDDEDDGVDLFASDSEEESAEATKIKEQRLAEYAAKKSKKPAIIAKSSIVLDVKPWDDTTDMKFMEKEVRKISTDGLLWGASKLVPLAYGIHKLQISCVVEDEKVSVDSLQEAIENIEDCVQSVDIAAFNKI